MSNSKTTRTEEPTSPNQPSAADATARPAAKKGRRKNSNQNTTPESSASTDSLTAPETLDASATPRGRMRTHKVAAADEPISTLSDADAANPFFETIPADPDALHAWIAKRLDVRIARTPLIEGHAAPFDYLIHTFFEGAFRGIGLPADGVATTSSSNQPVPQSPNPSASPSSPRGIGLLADGAATNAPVNPSRKSSRKSRASKCPHSSPSTFSRSSPDCTVWANRGGGKTYLAAIATLLDLLFKRKCQVRILAGSVEQGRRMHEHLRSFFELEQLDHVTSRITARRISIPAMKSAVEILAASQTSVRGTRVQKLRCDEVDLFDPELWSAAQLVTRSLPNTRGPWGDTIRGSVEALSTMHKPYGLMWKLVGNPSVARASDPCSDTESSDPNPNRNPAPNRSFLLTASRPLFRWGLLDVLEHCPPERACSTCPLEPECQGRAKFTPLTREGHITIDDATNMKFRVGRETWESEMLCLRPSRSSSVYPEFNPAIHVRPWHGLASPCSNSSSSASPSSPFSYMIAGMDFGFRGETVILLAGVTRTGRVHIIREHCQCEEILDRHIDGLDRWRNEGLFRHHTELGDAPPLEFIGIDPAGNAPDQQTGDTHADCLKKRGYILRSRKSDIYPGLTAVRDRLTPAWSPPRSAWGPSQFRGSALAPPREPGPQLVIDPCCTRLIECLTGYHFDESKPESLHPKKDGYDHACDALRYMLVNLDRPHKSECRNYLGGAA